MVRYNVKLTRFVGSDLKYLKPSVGLSKLYSNKNVRKGDLFPQYHYELCLYYTVRRDEVIVI